MADIPLAGKPISDYDAGTLTGSSLIAMSYPRAATGMSTGKISAASFGQGMGQNVVFPGLNTADKTLFGAINEISEMMPQNYSQKNFVASGAIPDPEHTVIMWFDNFFDTKAMYQIFTDDPTVVIKSVTIQKDDIGGSCAIFLAEPTTGSVTFKFVRIGYEEAPVTEIKYIKATGCQFAIPCYANEDLIFELKLRRNSNGGDIVASAHAYGEYLCECDNSGYILYTNSNGVNASSDTPNVGDWDTVILNKNGGEITVNGVTTTQASVGAIGGSKQLYMLGVNNARFLCADIQYIKVYKNDTLYLDLVPAQTSLGVGCFKDTLSDTEYVSSTASPLIYVEE